MQSLVIYFVFHCVKCGSIILQELVTAISVTNVTHAAIYPPLKIGVTDAVFTIPLKSTCCPCACMYTYSCCSRCSRHLCRWGDRFLKNKNKSLPCRISHTKTCPLVVWMAVCCVQQENVAVEFMEVFVVVSIATVYQKNGTATEDPASGIDPLRSLVLYTVTSSGKPHVKPLTTFFFHFIYWIPKKVSP